MQEQLIGRVISVDSFRVMIELNANVKSLFKSGFNDIYEIARINSYVSIPVGAEKIIAMITRVKISDETELEKSENSILLPKSKRYVVATMIGTIDNYNKYIQGVYNFPILDNPVSYVLRGELEVIFDYKSKDSPIDFKQDYFLSVGKSPAYSEFDVKINPDKFFNKHVAILGNTGSGKSCTIASIIQSMFRGQYQTTDGIKTLTDAHIIIFDTNGEYSKAFQFEEQELSARVNTFTITNEGLKVPFWFMNYDDFDYLFEPSQLTQAPVLKRAIALAKNAEQVESVEVSKLLAEPIFNKVLRLINLLEANDKDLKLFIIHELADLIETLQNNDNSSVVQIKIQLDALHQAKVVGNLNVEYGIKGDISSSVVNEAYIQLKKITDVIIIESETRVLSNEKDVDIPSFFDFQKIITEYIDSAINEIGSSQAKYKEYLSSLKLRISSYSSDERISTPFMLKSRGFKDSLVVFLTYILGGNLNSENGEETEFEKYRSQGSSVKVAENRSQITIIDMSLLPYEVLENITGLIGRMLLEFVQRIEKVEEYKSLRGKIPIAIVLEEAQNYIPQIERKKEHASISKRVFERIAREGRKYGLSLIISSQRPSELSKTVLSQCNTFIVHRLQNPEDQNYVRQLVSSANVDILNQLPILPQQHAIIMGDAVKSPSQVRFNDVMPRPGSDDPEVFNQWLGNSNEVNIKKVVDKWLKNSI
ncbi:DNA helicase HerA-like ATPase [Paenibacillus sp. DS2015]|uniref:ATP-binding protein n=1 Tax=Paenibacillus sp. DS2015 TaxID=3373917 RepID=UPI003D19D2F7